MGVELILFLPRPSNQPCGEGEEGGVLPQHPKDAQHAASTRTVSHQTGNGAKQLQLGSRIRNGLEEVEEERKNRGSLEGGEEGSVWTTQNNSHLTDQAGESLSQDAKCPQGQFQSLGLANGSSGQGRY